MISDYLDLARLLAGMTPKTIDARPMEQWLALSELETSFANTDSATEAPAWLAPLVERAEAIAGGKLSFFNLENAALGEPIRWQLDRNTGVEAALKPIQFVDYRDAPVFGDCKLVWEPNRHHHLVVLARAYKATGELKFAEAVVTQIIDWIDQNPYGYGMNWRSPLELSVRMINWVWAIDLIRDAGVLTPTDSERIYHCAYLHCHDVTRKYSQGTSANNHLVGEAAGVFIASCFFDFPRVWVDESQMILAREIGTQIYADGCTREHAFGYQFFVLQFYYFSASIAKRYGTPFGASYFDAMRKMIRFQLLLGMDGAVPLVGDADDGYVLDLGNMDDRVAIVAWINRAVDGSNGFDNLARPSEAQIWMEVDTSQIDLQSSPEPFKSVAFEDSRYYLLRSDENSFRVSMLFDCADLGYTSIAAHGHADALSTLMKINELDLFVDAGTYDYFTYPEWRNHFRSTRAHNTLEVDGHDQSVMGGAFLWEYHAIASCQNWEPTLQGGRVSGTHNGYQRLEDPVIHSRELNLQGEANQLGITDVLECQGQHGVKLHYHLAPGWQVSQDGNNIICEQDDVRVTIEFDERLSVQTARGDENSKLGWYSDTYHLRVPATTLIGSGQCHGGTQLKTRISWQKR